MEKINYNKNCEEITNRFPENFDIAKEMLEILENKRVKIEQAKDTGTSLYIAVTDKIILADLKNNYARIQTIAHECIHSKQDRRLLMFNFIFSNINIIYFIVSVILTICGIFKNTMLQIFILTLLNLIQFSIRSYLEIDAMTKARFLAEKYINLKSDLLSTEEKKILLKAYDEINSVGIPFTLDNLLSNSIIAIAIYVIVAMIW